MKRLAFVPLFLFVLFCIATGTPAGDPLSDQLVIHCPDDNCKVPEGKPPRAAIVIFREGLQLPEGEPLFNHEFTGGEYPSNQDLTDVLDSGAVEIRIYDVPFEQSEIDRVLNLVHGSGTPVESSCNPGQRQACKSGCKRRGPSRGGMWILFDVRCSVEVDPGTGHTTMSCTCIWAGPGDVA